MAPRKFIPQFDIIYSFIFFFLIARENKRQLVWLQERHLELGVGSTRVCHWSVPLHPVRRIWRLAQLLRALRGDCRPASSFCPSWPVLSWILLFYFGLVCILFLSISGFALLLCWYVSLVFCPSWGFSVGECFLMFVSESLIDLIM
jgi:hypothetical protein